MDMNKSNEAKTIFRNAMAHLASAVSIVTTNGIKGKAGITVSSVCTVTDEPPTLLFCINRQSQLHDVIKLNKKVCINILNHQQQELAKHFACILDSSMEERFNWDIWTQGNNELPVLEQAVANLQGDIIEHYQHGTHSIFIVQLHTLDVQPNHALTYFARQFKTISL